MHEYETIYVVKPDLPSDQVQGIHDKLEDILAKAEGRVLHHVDWGKRRLAYRVEKFHQAQYLYFQYLDRGASIAEIERILKYDDRVLKFLTVKLKERVNPDERLAQAGAAPAAPDEVFHEEASYDRDRPPRDRHFERRRAEVSPEMREDPAREGEE